MNYHESILEGRKCQWAQECPDEPQVIIRATGFLGDPAEWADIALCNRHAAVILSARQGGSGPTVRDHLKARLEETERVMRSQDAQMDKEMMKVAGATVAALRQTIEERDQARAEVEMYRVQGERECREEILRGEDFKRRAEAAEKKVAELEKERGEIVGYLDDMVGNAGDVVGLGKEIIEDLKGRALLSKEKDGGGE